MVDIFDGIDPKVITRSSYGHFRCRFYRFSFKALKSRAGSREATKEGWKRMVLPVRDLFCLGGAWGGGANHVFK